MLGLCRRCALRALLIPLVAGVVFDAGVRAASAAQDVPAPAPTRSPAAVPAPKVPAPAPAAQKVAPPPTPKPAASTPKAVAPKAPPKPVDYKKTRPPPQPSPRLPAGATGQAQDPSARRQIVGDKLPEDQRSKANDPELVALRAAERVLFPRALVGFKPGWSWGTADPSVQADGLPPSIEALPSATVTAAKDAEWLRSLALPDFPIRLDPLVVEYLRFYRDTDQGRAIAQVWARKVGRYSAAMQEELAKAGLPRDLVWLSLIESGHNPTIVSPAGAAGMWQFIPDSGRIYGLTVDKWVDERLDPARSSQAASRYLADLYTRFGTWEMAMAAYNMGHAGLLKTVRKYNTNDYWKLVHYEAALPWETILYVPKVFAIAIVMNNRRAFNLQDIEPDPAITFDTVYVDAGVQMNEVAKASGVALDALRSMNPEYLNERLPLALPAGEKDAKVAQRWPVRLPRGMGQKTLRGLMQPQYRTSYDAYCVRFGDTLETVAAQFQTTVPKLAALNVVLESASLVPGGVILVPRVFAGSPAASVEGEFIVVPRSNKSVAGRSRVFYRVLRGDTLASVANALDVTADELVVWNDLDARSKLQGGMTLQVFVPAQADLSRVRVLSPRDARLLEVGSAEFLTYFEALNGRKRVSVKALKGDTLEKIGKRHGLSVGMMERINRCSRNRVLKVGEEVIVYSKTEASPKSKESADAVKVSLGRETLYGRPLAQVAAPRPDLLP